MTAERDWLRDSVRDSFVSSLAPLLSAGLRGGALRNFGRGRRATIGLRPGLPALLIFIEGFPRDANRRSEHSALRRFGAHSASLANAEKLKEALVIIPAADRQKWLDRGVFVQSAFTIKWEL